MFQALLPAAILVGPTAIAPGDPHDPVLGEASAPLEAPIAALTPQAPAAEGIWSRLQLNADGRVRGESTFDQINDVDRHRGRLRFRFGGEYKIASEIRAGARVTTLSDGRDANNPHWDFGDGADGFSAAEVGLDRLYLGWRPTESLDFVGGKFGHTFTRPPVTREFAWDDDVQPAGAAITWAPKLEDSSVQYDVRLVTVVATEINADAGSGSDPAMYGLQTNLMLEASESVDVHLATSLSKWTNLGHFSEFPSAGNTIDADAFLIWDTYASATLQSGDSVATTAFAQYLNNIGDESGEDTGFVAGLQFGRTSGKGNGNVFAAVYSLDANAIFAPVAQDDTPIPGTGTGEGMDGYVLGYQHFLTDNLAVRLWGLTSDADDVEDPYRVRLDFDFRVR
jgi:hypothetical protein